jgi:NADH:ubiquinone oxidoreductase subunit 4 (subunit M)
MNLILFLFLLGDNNSILCGIIFSATHAFLSTLMFFIVDCIYRRFHSRSIYNIQGLLHVTPNLAITIVGMCVLYAGLPGTLKFTCEFYIFSTLVEMS